MAFYLGYWFWLLAGDKVLLEGWWEKLCLHEENATKSKNNKKNIFNSLQLPREKGYSYSPP